jgi:hypothetical protein
MAKAKKTARAASVIVNDPSLEKYVKQAAESAGGSSWTPTKPGDWIGGTVTAMKAVKGKWGEQTLLTLETKGGRVSHYCNGVLRDVLDRLAVKPGRKVVITFVGLRPSKKGRPYKLYGAVIVK